MTTNTVVFAIYDSTTFRTLVPVANNVTEDYSVKFLLLDRLLPQASSKKKMQVRFEGNNSTITSKRLIILKQIYCLN